MQSVRQWCQILTKSLVKLPNSKFCKARSAVLKFLHMHEPTNDGAILVDRDAYMPKN
jgi:hypothetical protein